jgi:hypothetical protein
MRIDGREYSKQDVRKRVGDMEQIAGVRKMQFAEGKAKNLSCYEFNTGGGLEYTILADRGLDIALARYKGYAFSYCSKTGFAQPCFYSENKAEGFLRVFGAGLLTTCGYTYMGAPCEVNGKNYGLHGKATGIPADQLCARAMWIEDEYEITVSGAMRESIVFGENVVLQRKISSLAGQNVIYIDDVLKNEGYQPTPLMMLYHINFGFPFLSEETELYIPAIRTEPTCGNEDRSEYLKIERPQENYVERVYYHDIQSHLDGSTVVGLFNPELNDPFGVYIRFNKHQLPVLTQWKQMGEQDYVLGLEPGTNKTLGYRHAKEHERLIILEPEEEYHIHAEIGIIETQQSWEKLKKEF